DISMSARIVRVDIMSSAQVTRARVAAESRLDAMPCRLTHARGVAAAADGLRGHFDVASGDCLVAAAWLRRTAVMASVSHRRTCSVSVTLLLICPRADPPGRHRPGDGELTGPGHCCP